jgi:hypothetical protein
MEYSTGLGVRPQSTLSGSPASAQDALGGAVLLPVDSIGDETLSGGDAGPA